MPRKKKVIKPEFATFEEFQAAVQDHFIQQGWEIEESEDPLQACDFILREGKQRVAVQVKNLKMPVNSGHLTRFMDFLDDAGEEFSSGFFISSSGYSSSAVAAFEHAELPQLYVGTFRENKLTWQQDVVEPPDEDEEVVYIGVFTCKGGVGKTTVAAHLAGAFALQGYDVALLDLDPHQNLVSLVGDSVYVPSPNRRRRGAVVSVFNHKEWDEDLSPEIKVVVCDCAPVYRDNPKELLERFDYCLIPTTLNPLGINKNGDVIERTMHNLRKVNELAHLFVLINQFETKETTKIRALKKAYQNTFELLMTNDRKFNFIDPEVCSIRQSNLLYYWGYHLITGAQPALAFTPVAGRCNPREDFLNLVDYLEEKAQLESFKSQD